MVITMAKLRIATPPRVAHAKPPGPIKEEKNQLISAKQPNLIITRNGFDIIVN